MAQASGGSNDMAGNLMSGGAKLVSAPVDGLLKCAAGVAGKSDVFSLGKDIPGFPSPAPGGSDAKEQQGEDLGKAAGKGLVGGMKPS